MKTTILLAAALSLGGCASANGLDTAAAPTRDWTVKREWIAAHERFLAGPELQGRGSATRDEAIAAAYVAARFQGYGVEPAPGMDGYLQKANVVRLGLDGAPVLSVGGKRIARAALLYGSGHDAEGALSVADGDDASALPGDAILLATSRKLSPTAALRAAGDKGVRLLIMRESDATRALRDRLGGKPRLPSYVEGDEPKAGLSLVTLPDAAVDALAGARGKQVAMTLPGLIRDRAVTTNAIGYLPGSDPDAGVILLSAHLDHLGRRDDGTVMPGANDDASGTTAVLELAHALAKGPQHRRGILFVAYGSEEIGGFGSRWFGAHPPVPLDSIIANIEVEMIGAQDPKLPAGTMMMTGFERSNLGPALAEHGALLAKDPYLDQHFFERSDNYSLALKGVVAHTISGWAVTPTYHSSDDTIANLDIGFMATAIQSLIGPVRWLADSDFEPQWQPGGRPVEQGR